MRCPVCEGTDLSISSREGVEIDFCPQCRGVWLDRGELDKIIDRAGAVLAPSVGGDPRRGDRSRDDDRDDRGDRYDRGDRDDRYDRGDRSDRGDRYDEDRRERGYDPRKRRKRSFLDDIFEFD
jgi:Zn-finger nucleic acid-binding protein